MKNTEITQEQIQEWKERYGVVYAMPVDEKVAYLREPNMLDYKMGFSKMEDEGELAFGEAMINSLWLGGDEEIRNDDAFFIPAKKELVKLLKYDDAIVTDLPNRQKEIRIGEAVAVVRIITREDLRMAERKNPNSKIFITQEVLFDMIKVSADEDFEDKNNASIRMPLYKALEQIQNQKVAQLKKL